MNLNLSRIGKKILQNDFIKNFTQELSKALENNTNKKINNIELTPEENIEFCKQQDKFLQNYFKNELNNLDKGEVFIVTNKYENDDEYHRYKVTQYKNNLECKYITFEKDLPENVHLGDVVRKINGKYIYDEQATKYVNNSINKLKEDIINNR